MTDRGTGSRLGGMDWEFVMAALRKSLLPLWFALYAALTLREYASHGYLGIDIALYRYAAIAALSGGDPWAVQSSGLAFAGPPSTLLFYLPTTLVSLQLATMLLMSLGLAAAVWAVRRLKLPLWWLLFPPVFEALIVGNPDVLVLALLLLKGPMAGLAAGLKVYAVIPLLLQRRWAAVMVSALVVLASLPLLPAFLASLTTVATVLDSQTAKLSAWGTVLVIPVVAALVILRRHGASWLVVPSLWPNTQGHYGAMALPAISRFPLAAAIFGLNTPLAPPVGVMLAALQLMARSRPGSPPPSRPGGIDIDHRDAP